MRDRQRERETDRQAERETHTQTEREKDRQTHRQRDTQTGRNSVCVYESKKEEANSTVIILLRVEFNSNNTIVLYCTLLLYTTLYCFTLHSTALHCTLLLYTTLYCFYTLHFMLPVVQLKKRMTLFVIEVCQLL